MSELRLAAELLRQAAADDNYARDLDDAIADNESLRSALLQAPLDTYDIAALRPSQLLWFAEWRQARGGELDRTLLDNLDAALTLGSRFARYRLRGLPMRDPHALNLASFMTPSDRLLDDDAALDAIGLDWLIQHATTFRDPGEVARDALQYATQVSWFTLRVLTRPSTRGSAETAQYLRDFATSNQTDPDITEQWGIRG